MLLTKPYKFTENRFNEKQFDKISFSELIVIIIGIGEQQY